MYLVAYYLQKPSNSRIKTNKAGWMKVSENISYDEQVTITKNLKNRDITMAKVILDLRRKTIVRNAWGTNKNFNDLFKYFHKGYPKYASIMAKIDPEYYKDLFTPELPTLDTASISLINPSTAIKSEVRVVDTPST